MTEFFSVSHNGFENRGFPWARSIISGLKDRPTCSTCGVISDYPSGDLLVRLEKKKARFWPDALGCGAWPVFIVSARVLEVWESNGVEVPSVGRVYIAPPAAPGLVLEDAPAYHWIDGEALLDTKLDFDASGFVGVEFCPECGRRTDDVRATYDRRRSAVWPYAIREETWGRRALFTTDLSPAAFFCTRKLVDLASEFKLTNFRFVPTEKGGSGAPIQYLERGRSG
jgi:hypothetical protein